MMFGYVRYDFPNLFVKDVMLYKALYCGLCKSIGAACGQRARMGLTYDMTFLSALLHNISGTDIVVERQNCFEHAIKKRPIARVDELTMRLGALNTALIYYKLSDDVKDGGKGRGKRSWFKAGFRRARKKYPEIVGIVERYLAAQNGVERESAPPDIAADPTACMMRAVSAALLGDKATEDTGELFYALGKWVYLIDALDDYEKDGKAGNFNPFVNAYGREDRETLMRRHGEDVSFLFDTLFYAMREHLAGIKFYFNRDLTDNVILRGIPLETMRVIKGEPRAPMTSKF